MDEDNNTVPILIFLTDIPNKAIKIKAPYTKGMVECKPRNKSEINKLIIGIEKMIHRLLKPLLHKSAIAAIGVKFGG